MKIVVLIPCYHPDFKLITLVNDLLKNGISKIIIVDDGNENKEIFKKITNENVKILSYQDNQGKGYALKYGFKYYLDNYQKDYLGLITVDCDYQHTIKDILNIIKKIEKDNSKIYSGVRNFNLKHVPTPNKLGNKLTSLLFKLLYKEKITDTQTGLRAIGNPNLNFCLKIPGNRFEYEMNQLIYFVKAKIKIKEVEIETIYQQDNNSTFNKFTDSFKIYKVLLKEPFKFVLISLLSFLLDITLYTISVFVLNILIDKLVIIISTIFARIVSSYFNYNFNKNFVFDYKNNDNKALLRYYLLCIIIMLTSAFSVLFIYTYIPIFSTFIKIVVDLLLYFVSYYIQKHLVFKK